MEKQKELQETEFILCACHSVEHQIVFRKDEELKYIYMQPYTSNLYHGTSVLFRELNIFSVIVLSMEILMTLYLTIHMLIS